MKKVAVIRYPEGYTNRWGQPISNEQIAQELAKQVLDSPGTTVLTMPQSWSFDVYEVTDIQNVPEAIGR